MKLHLGGNLPFHSPGRVQDLQVLVEGRKSLTEVLTKTGIPLGEVYLVVVNGEVVTLEAAQVEDKDEVKVYPPVDGG